MKSHIPIPKGKAWQQFLKDTENKRQLFKYLSEELTAATIDERYHLLNTKDELVLSNKECNLSGLSLCTQEEADTRLMLHCNHAAEEGH